jgi:amino acid transporter
MTVEDNPSAINSTDNVNASVDPGAAEHRLAVNVIGLLQGTIFSVASAAPTLGTSLALAAIIVASNRGGAISMLIVAVPMLAIAWSFARLNQWDPNCGSAYVWVGRIAGPYLGFLVGWVVILANVLALAASTLPVGPSFLSLIGVNASNRLGAAASSTLLVAFVTVLAILGIVLTARAQLVMAVTEFAILLTFIILGLVKTFGTHPHGFARPSIGWLSPVGIGGHGQLVATLLVAVFLIAGWEAPVYVNEETKERRKNPGRAAVISVGIIAVTYALTLTAFQGVASVHTLNANAGAGLSFIGQRLAGAAGDKFLSIAVLLSAVATIQVTTVAAARVMYAMGADRLLPSRFGSSNSRHLTPAFATAACGIGVIVLASVSIYFSSVASAFGTLINTTGVLFGIFYAAVALASSWHHLQQRPFNRREATVIVVPAVAAGFLIWICWKSIEQFTTGTKWAGLGLLGAGIVLMLWAKFRYHSPFFGIRSTEPSHR